MVIVVGTWYLHGQVAQGHGPIADGAGRDLRRYRQLPFALVVAHPSEAVDVYAGNRRDVPIRGVGTGYVGILRPPRGTVRIQGEEEGSLPVREVVLGARQVECGCPLSGHVRVS